MTQATHDEQQKEADSEDDAKDGAVSEQADGPSADQNLSDLAQALEEEKKKYLYLYADFENYKKRSIRERSETMKFGWEGVARDLLTIADDLERALLNAPEDLDKNFRKGVEMVFQEFLTALKKKGVEVVESLNVDFNPNVHEAVGQAPSDDVESGKVMAEQRKGYTLHGRLLRPSQVIVSMGKSNKENK